MTRRSGLALQPGDVIEVGEWADGAGQRYTVLEIHRPSIFVRPASTAPRKEVTVFVWRSFKRISQ